MRSMRPFVLLLPFLLLGPTARAQAAEPPASILDPIPEGFAPRDERPRYSLTFMDVWDGSLFSPDSEGKGLRLDLGRPEFSGRVHTGPFWYGRGVSEVITPRWRRRGDLQRGRALLTIDENIDVMALVGRFGGHEQGVLAVRLELIEETDRGPRFRGFLDSRVHYRKLADRYEPMLSIVEGPMVCLVRSDDPSRPVIALECDREAVAWIEVQGIGDFPDPTFARRHEIELSGLQAASSYRYRALASADEDTAATPWLSLRTAPSPGEGETVLVYAGDSRRGYGGGESEYQGVNRDALGRIARAALRHDADLLLFGGDLVNGYVDRPGDLRNELKACKQAIAPFTWSRPLFTALGNHEAVVRRYEPPGEGWALWMDRWPYATDSAEALFAQELVQPRNGPADASDRPSYRENVYTFRHGPLQVLVCNNNYWYTIEPHVSAVGGCPEGYLLPDQMEWIQRSLDRAEADPTVRYVIVVMHEPIFPAGGHADDAMWHGGDDRMRAWRADGSGGLEPYSPGMIELRNALWTTLSRCPKLAAVFTSDEHNYQRTLIGPTTPVGVPTRDDADGNGRLDDGRFSPNPAFGPPLWCFVSGGAGAPYYLQEEVPWGEAVHSFHTINHYLLLRAGPERIGLETWSLEGDRIDAVEDLMAVRR